jgi:excisionase family DNA binding protein
MDLRDRFSPILKSGCDDLYRFLNGIFGAAIVIIEELQAARQAAGSANIIVPVPSAPPSSSQEDEGPERLLTVEEAADFLRVKPSTIHSWVSKDRIKYRRSGRLLRFLKSELLERTAKDARESQQARQDKRNRTLRRMRVVR